jgi:adenosylcobinamide-phosphate synthase
LALAVDAIAGEPAALYARVPHPVVLLGRLVGALERSLLRAADPPARQRWRGVALLAAVVGAAAGVGLALERVLLALPLGPVWLALAASSLLAQRSLVDHVRAVADGLRAGLGEGRRAVAMIVGRDPGRLDAHGVARAAIESLAENLSDGVVAPAFWFLVGGLPGLAAYKAVNTLDSMVGHKSERYRHFGWASARLDDLANLVPARATALLLLVAGLGPRRAAVARAWRRVAADAPRHRSPNAGWPEAAMADLLGLRLAGPRVYVGERVEDAWMGDGDPGATPDHVERAVRLAWRAWGAMLGIVLGLALLF